MQINPEENIHSIVADKDEKVVAAKGQEGEALDETKHEESFNGIQ